MPLEQHPTDPGKLVFRAHPAALRLADRLEGRWALHPEMQEAAAELRRLAAENEAFGIHLSERMKDLAKAEAQRDALAAELAALKEK